MPIFDPSSLYGTNGPQPWLSAFLGDGQMNYQGKPDDWRQGWPNYSPPPPMYSEPNGDQSGSQPYASPGRDPYGLNPVVPQQSSVYDTGSYTPQRSSWPQPGSPLAQILGIGSPAQPQSQPQSIAQPQLNGGTPAEPSQVWTAPALNAPQFPGGVPLPQSRPQQMAQGSQPLDINPLGPIGQAASSIPPAAAPAQYQQPSQKGPAAPDFFDRLDVGANNFANSPGLIGKITGAMQGFKSGRDSGAVLQKTGTDPFTGQDTFVWVNQRTQTMTPATMSGQPSGAPAVHGLPEFSAAVSRGASPEELKKMVPPMWAPKIQAMLEGREAPPTAAGMRNPQIQAQLQIAHAIDPKFDETNWGVRSNLAKNYMAGGKQFQELQAINTVAGHLDTLAKRSDDLDNTNFPLINTAINAFRQQTGDPRIVRFGAAVQAVTNELSKAYRGGHVTEGDVNKWNAIINSNMSGPQLKGAIGEFNDLLASKRTATEQGYRDGMGGVPLPGEFSSVSKKSGETFDRIAKWAGGETQGRPGVTSTGIKWSVQ